MPASKHLLYNGTIEIEFLDDYFHTYRIVGTKDRLTSVTAISGQLDKSGALIYWAVNLMRDFLNDYIEKNTEFNCDALKAVVAEASKQHAQEKERAGSIGDTVHDFALAYANAKTGHGDMPTIEDWPREALNGINGFLDWVKARKVKFIESERVVYSKRYEYVGRTDAIVTMGDDPTHIVLDYKTSNGIYAEMLLQLCLYWTALREELGTEYKCGMIVRFDKETGEFHDHVIDVDLYQIAGGAALALVEVKKILSNKRIKEFLKAKNDN